jgi:hypothetical protein
MARKVKGNKRGKQTKAGKLLSGFIREIAGEETEFIKGDDGDDRMATKAEALARTIWKLALGYKEVVVKTDKSGVRSEVKIPHDPNSTYIGIILDRTEGRAPLINDGKDGKLSVPDRISQEGKNRINNIIKDRKK